MRPGAGVIVAGGGGDGHHAVQGAARAGATAVIAVDPVELKRQKALEVGATHAFDNIAEAADFARSITDWQGADSAILTVGSLRGQDVADAFYAIRKAGTVVVTAIAPSSEVSIPIPPLEITRFQKRIQGAVYGASNPRADIPRQYGMYLTGQLKLDELISATYALDDIDQGYVDLLEGRNMRGGIKHPATASTDTTEARS